MYIVRRWSTRNARFLEILYRAAESLFLALTPLWRAIGPARLERPFRAVEAWSKGLLFDCSMCGRCELSATGMTCVMNCPKSIRNGPCGGVRADGGCEVKPEIRCVWVEAWQGARLMRDGMTAIRAPLPPLDHSMQGASAWLRLAAEKLERAAAERAGDGAA